jgi:hypothetical protein
MIRPAFVPPILLAADATRAMADLGMEMRSNQAPGPRFGWLRGQGIANHSI